MSVLLTGAGGQIGSALRRLCPPTLDLLSLYRRPCPDTDTGSGVAGAHSMVMDLADLNAISTLLQQQRFDVIINAAAWTAVDAAQQQPQAAWQLNAELPALLAARACEQDSLLLHYSTDYVHDGSQKTNHLEDAEPAPLNVYGRSKLAGDQAIQASGCRHLILRTSWVYGGPGSNFLDTIAARLMSAQPLRVVDDQIGCPTWSEDIARCSWQALDAASVQPAFNAGLYHLAGADAMSWYDFAVEIQVTLAAAGVLPPASSLNACGSDDYPQAAQRPSRVVLDSSAFRQRFGARPDGRAAIRRATLHWLSAWQQCA